MAAVALASTVLTSYAKARAELDVGKLTGGLLERGERIGLIAAGGILGLMQPVMWLLALGSTITVAQRIGLAYRAMQALDASAATHAAPVAAGATQEEGR